ncbi:oxidoreductase [Chania multitudinisentens RB-25]|uniref:Oxidoreductase n=2 Tax=Chania TaxID=1745211 RepID=W0L9F4_9GAMM|nr:3-oxoacyl-ACP reductase family protein [Chania multitudinisentens]AHG18882.1 oxidoreductase [Chania multitudinisentens RB-25]
MDKLNNKVALVTGGSRGMGAAIAKRLAQEGANVALTYVNSQEKADNVIREIERLGRRGMAIAADNRDPVAVRLAVEHAIAELGPIDILVNNAGIFEVQPLETITLDDFQRNIDINVKAVFIATQVVASQMKDGGRIITIGSNLAERLPMQGLSLYALSKSALIGFTKAIARDLGARGITANIIHPGPTDTDMNPADSDFADMQRSKMSIPYYAEPRDIAGLVAWLASEEGRYVTGTGITIDSGTNV